MSLTVFVFHDLLCNITEWLIRLTRGKVKEGHGFTLECFLTFNEEFFDAELSGLTIHSILSEAIGCHFLGAVLGITDLLLIFKGLISTSNGVK